jgi:hypothetical protein
VKQLLAIIMAFSLYLPNIAMLAAYTACEIKELSSDKQPCDCILTSIPATDQQGAAPDKQKEIIRQTDWKYISTAKESLDFPLSDKINGYPDFAYSRFTADFNNSVFHPPAFSQNALMLSTS